MTLIDSNIIVYSYLPQYKYLRELFFNEPVYVSEISRIEVLGYRKLNTDEETYFKDIFSLVPVLIPSQQIFDAAIQLRKTYNMKLGDSIIAATALVHELTIYTSLTDFEKIIPVKCVNPISY